MILHSLVTMLDLRTALQHYSADWAAAVFTVPEQSEFLISLLQQADAHE